MSSVTQAQKSLFFVLLDIPQLISAQTAVDPIRPRERSIARGKNT
jgi:hypothetical protein